VFIAVVPGGGEPAKKIHRFWWFATHTQQMPTFMRSVPSPLRSPRLPLFSALGALLLCGYAHAADYYVAPDGSGERCSRATPCNIGTGAEKAQAGDTVLLQDGIYEQGLHAANSGTPDAWITFRPDECALPIIEGDGEAAVADADGNYPTGVYVSGEYIRFIGIVSRHWDSGFGNVWTGNVEQTDGVLEITPSNGHLEYVNCIGDGNHRTAFAMYSASGLVIRESIAAHSGGSTTHSWSSGIQLYAVRGEPGDNVVERSVSFENTDAQKNNDGSGFIVDEYTDNAWFDSNIAFGNGGSCLRLTRSESTKMSHFSCYHNGRNPTPNSPTDPGEIYFTDDPSRTGDVFNSLLAASGTESDPQAFQHPPAGGFPDNVVVDQGDVPFFTDPEGLHPDFRPPAEAAASVENTARDVGPALDIGFDPQCIVRQVPDVPYQQAWWTYSIDYDYIRSIGGVAECFHPKERTGGPDMGAYELSGPPHEFSVPGSCVPSPIEPDPVEATGGVSGAGGSAGTGATAGTGAATGTGATGGAIVGTGSGSTGAAPGESAGGASAAPQSSDAKGGCSSSPTPRSATPLYLAWMSLLGAVWARRRRRSNTDPRLTTR
jgi:MYXO-CTERM domain-containing protein